MSPQENNLLIDYLDNLLEEKELNTVQELIRNDEEMAKEWQALQFTVASIAEAGLYTQVGTIREQYNTALDASRQQKGGRGIVRTMTQKMMRVAAVLAFVTFSAIVYKYISVNDSSVYSKYYAPYELHTSRSAGNEEKVEDAFKNNRWNEVITITNGTPDKTSKHIFLAGVAYLELNQYSQAVKSFESVLENNKIAQDDYFKDEAEYYLAMSYLANKDRKKALPMLEKIRNDKDHLYNQLVTKMGVDFKILQIKDSK